VRKGAEQPGGKAASPRHTLAQSFRWAFAGLSGAALRERNMRIHLALGVLASGAAALLPLDGGERGLLLLTVALVVAGEAANSALEAVVDLVSPTFSAAARLAKDAAAAAVLVLACGSVVVLLSVALPVLPVLRGRLVSFGVGSGGVFVASVAAGLLPSPPPRPFAVDTGLFLAGVAGLAVLARSARGLSGVFGAALLFALSAGAAVRRRRGVDLDS